MVKGAQLVVMVSGGLWEYNMLTEEFAWVHLLCMVKFAGVSAGKHGFLFTASC
jgi:hypothetical protein